MSLSSRNDPIKSKKGDTDMFYTIAITIVLILDQWLKSWATINIAPLENGAKTLIPKVLDLAYVRNYGASFGMLADIPLARWILMGVAVAAVILIIVLIARNVFGSRLANWSLVFILAGALGNLSDRVFNGYVIDMLRFTFIKFPTFNLADVFICVSVFLLVIALLFCGKDNKDKGEKKEKSKKQKKQKKQDEPAPASENSAPAEEPSDPVSGFRRKPDKPAEPVDEARLAENEEEFWSQFKFGRRAEKPDTFEPEAPVDPLRFDPVRGGRPAPAPAPAPAPEPEPMPAPS